MAVEKGYGVSRIASLQDAELMLLLAAEHKTAFTKVTAVEECDARNVEQRQERRVHKS